MGIKQIERLEVKKIQEISRILVNNLQIILVSCKSSNENLPVIVNWNGVAEARLFGHVQDLFQYAFGTVYTGALSIQTAKWDWASCHFGSSDQVSTRWTRLVFFWLINVIWIGKKLAWPWFTHFPGSDLDVFAIAGCSDRKDYWHLKPAEWESEGGKGLKGPGSQRWSDIAAWRWKA